MDRIINILITISLIITILFIAACEDDAILRPQNESECTGSYCSLNLPGMIIKKQYINSEIF